MGILNFYQNTLAIQLFFRDNLPRQVVGSEILSGGMIVMQHMSPPRKIAVFRLLSFFALFLLLFAVIEPPRAVAEPTDTNPIRNGDFELGTIGFWDKWPSNAPGTVGVDARANKTPRGTVSAFIEPNNANVNTQLQQNITVTPGKLYRLQVWVTTNGMTAYVEYWSNVGGNVVCGQTSVV